MWKLLVAIFVLASCTAAFAESYTRTFAKGSWALYRVDGMRFRAPGGEYEPLDGLCMAAFVSRTASLKLAMAPAEIARRRPVLRDYIWVEIASEKWNFRRRTAPAGLSVEISSYTERSATYDGFAIGFGVPDFKNSFGIFLMFAGARETIDVLDRKGKVIARFPAAGFAEVRDRLYACAGA